MKEEIDRLPQPYQSFFNAQRDPLHPVTKSYEGINNQGCACPFFNPVTHECLIYLDRPLDCQLYPFVLLLSPTQKRVFLGLDTQCPFVQDISHHDALTDYGESVRHFLEEKETVERISRTPGLLGKGGDTILPLYPLSGLTEKLFRETLFGTPPPPSLGLLPLTLKDREILALFFSSSPKAFSDESLVSLFIFSDLLRYYWKKEKEALFVVAEQGNSFFMPIPPLAPKRNAAIFERGLSLLEALNAKRHPSRIENVSEEDLPLVAQIGCTTYPKSPEYLYRREALVALRGDAYKSKRSSYNIFTKRYAFAYEPYQKKYFSECLRLFKKWQEEKFSKTTDPYEQSLLEDATFIHRRTLLHADSLHIEGRVVRVGGEIKGYTFGYPLTADTFCILLEIADPNVKGLAQFLFREFCREKEAFPFISAMDDSDVEYLRRVKESYRPILKKIPYVAMREPI